MNAKIVKRIQAHRRSQAEFGCWVCRIFGENHALPDGLECSGPWQAHHVLAKRWLRGVHSPIPTEFQPIALSDDRNLLTVRLRHHEAIEDGRVKISRATLAQRTRVIEFVEDYGLEAMLERFYPLELQHAPEPA